MKESPEKDGKQGEEGTDRHYFLKTAAIGLGAAGIASMVGGIGGIASAEEGKQGRYIVVVTHGGEDPNRAILSLILALQVLDKGLGSVHVWITIGGGELAHKGKANRIISPIFKQFGNGEELMLKLKEKGATFGICPPCADYMGAVGADKFDFVERQGGDWLMKNMVGAEVAWM